MSFEQVRLIVGAIFQSFFLGATGYFLVKKRILANDCLISLSRLVIYVALPMFILSQLIRDFSFHAYPNWWFFPLLSVGITILGLVLGRIFAYKLKTKDERNQFISLVAFQNAGYLPIALVSAILLPEQASPILTQLVLFLLGFNLVVWSLGWYMLKEKDAQNRKFSLKSLLSPPVVATLAGLLLIALGAKRFIPQVIIKPMHMAGECTVPLALFVLGGSLALIKLENVRIKEMLLLVLIKLILLPLVGIILVLNLKFSFALGLLIMMQLAMPPAVSLSVINRNNKSKDIFISQGIFFGHLVGLLTVPLFLSLYFSIAMLK